MAVKWVTGDEKLDRALKDLGKQARTVAAAGIRAALNEIKKGIKSELPTRIRPAIGSRFKRRRPGVVEAKVGGKVGKTRSYGGRRPSGGRPGVGISGRNVHWYLMGTASRFHRTSGSPTGAMPKVSAVPVGTRKTQGRAMVVARKKMRERLIKIAAKHAKK